MTGWDPFSSSGAATVTGFTGSAHTLSRIFAVICFRIRSDPAPWDNAFVSVDALPIAAGMTDGGVAKSDGNTAAESSDATSEGAANAKTSKTSATAQHRAYLLGFMGHK